MQKAVLKLDVHCEKIKKKAMATVGYISGVESVDVKEGKLTVTGDIDAFMIVKKLKKICYTEIITVGPAKEPEKKKPEEPKQDQKPVQVIYQYPSSFPPPYYHYDDNPNVCLIL